MSNGTQVLYLRIQNLIGSSGESPVHSSSLTPCLLAILTQDQQLPPLRHLEIEGLSSDQMDEAALAAVRLATERLEGPTQRIEFIAKRLLYGPDRGGELVQGSPGFVLLGSPLYVRVNDLPPSVIRSTAALCAAFATAGHHARKRSRRPSHAVQHPATFVCSAAILPRYRPWAKPCDPA
jgi:hypothetical protein